MPRKAAALTIKTAKKPSAEVPLREACLIAAQEVIAERGVEALSLREVARKLGVSHQAPYKHYANRDELLSEVMRRCFRHFASSLDARKHFDDPQQDLESLGQSYLSYAQQHPLQYRLMFSTSWPNSAEDKDLIKDASYAFDILLRVLRRMHGDGPAVREAVELDALFIWSTVHGVAGVLNGPCVNKIELGNGVLNKAVAHAMERMRRGMMTDI